MSYINFEKALELAKRCDGYIVSGEKNDSVIHKAENLFGKNFSRQNKEFFKRIGSLDFFGNEIYGIVKDDFSGLYVGCSLEATLSDREKYNLPEKLLIIYDFGFDGYMGYLDYSQLNEEGEPPVVMAYYNGAEYVITEKIAEDLGDFILELVQEVLLEQEKEKD